MAAGTRAADTGRMASILIYCRPRNGTHAHTLRAWLERQAAALSARPEIGRSTVVGLTTAGPDGPREHGWLLDCELVDAACPPSAALRELLTDMRLVGFDPIIFMAQPPAGVTAPGTSMRRDAD
jgi:hypothetical protein